MSHWQNNIDFEALNNSQSIDFMIIRAGHGLNVYDTKFERNYTFAKKYKIPLGVYLYANAQTVEEARDEANHLVDIIKGRSFELPIFYDGVRREFISNNVINRYMTQNPYSPELIRGWGRLHASGNVDIIVGAYGRISDKDKEQKLLMLEKLIRDMNFSELKKDYTELEDYYFAAVGSDRKTLNLVKTPTRGKGF